MDFSFGSEEKSHLVLSKLHFTCADEDFESLLKLFDFFFFHTLNWIYLAGVVETKFYVSRGIVLAREN